MTAHVLETLAFEGRAGDSLPAVVSTGCSRGRRATAPGSGAGARTTSTEPARSPRPRRLGLGTTRASRAGRQFLERVQNPGGGFGEDLRSYRDRSWSGRGASTASQTAWGLLGLHASGAGDGEAAAAAMRFLAETQRDDGGWDEPFYTGTGFPGDFYLNYHLYRDMFPVMALGRVLGAPVKGPCSSSHRYASNARARGRDGIRSSMGMGPRARARRGQGTRRERPRSPSPGLAPDRPRAHAGDVVCATSSSPTAGARAVPGAGSSRPRSNAAGLRPRGRSPRRAPSKSR